MKFLLIGTSDLRHVAATAAKNRSNQQLQFFFIESQAPVLARHLLMLSILFERLDDVSLGERAELFLECYGNLLVREKTAAWIKEQASYLIRVMTDGKGILSKIVDFSNLKFRERDDIEFSLKYWRDDSRKFDAKALWDLRLRQYYGVRYDTRENAIDWDYNMKILDADKKTSVIHKNEFMRWRMHGIAFEVRESIYSFPNRSMATVDVLKQNGVNVPKWGYFSDILFGPFAAFGLDTSAKEMLKTTNGVHKHTSQEISEYNLRSIIHQLRTGTDYEESSAGKITSADEMDSAENDILDRLKIVFLPCDASYTFDRKRLKYENTFDRIVVSAAMAHRIPSAAPLLRAGGQLVVEGAKFILEFAKEHVDAFDAKICEMASAAGLVRKNQSRSESERSAEFLVFEKPIDILRK